MTGFPASAVETRSPGERRSAANLERIPGEASINVPVVCAGALVQPGDAILADDDGVVTVSRSALESVLQAAQQREERETKVRARLAAGELGLDIYDMRRKLERLGLVYLDHGNAGLSGDASGVSNDRAKSENERNR